MADRGEVCFNAQVLSHILNRLFGRKPASVKPDPPLPSAETFPPSLEEIEQRVLAIASAHGIPASDLSTFGRSKQDGTPHIEVNETCDYVSCERGSEFSRRSTRDLDELFYWIFADATWSMASRYELKHRRHGEDFRRQMFAKHLEILGALSPPWAERHAAKYERILAEHPFNDSL